MRCSACLLFALLFSLTGKAQYTTFQRTYGDSTHDLGYGIATKDSGMLFGFTQNPYQPNSRVILLKTDSLGNEIWKKVFGDSTLPVEFSGLIPARDTGCILSLYIGGSSPSNTIVKISRTGNIIWSKVGNISCGYEDYSGSYISLGGNTRHRYDAFGNYVTSIHYGDSTEYSPCWGIETSDSGAVIVGVTETYASGGPNDWDGFISRIDKAGNLLWAKAIGTDSLDQFINVDQTFDGGFILVGKTALYGTSTKNDVWLVKIDSNGNLQWSKVYGGASEDRGIYVKQTFGTPGYIFIGETIGNETQFPALRSFLYKVDFTGNFQWGKIYGDVSNGSPADDYIDYAYETQQGGFLLTGTTGSFGAGMYDLWCIKTDNVGSSGCNEVPTLPTVYIPALTTTSITTFQNITFTMPPYIPIDSINSSYQSTVLCSNPPGLGMNELSNENSLTVYPNPSSGTFSIKLESANAKKQVSVYNTLGQLVFSSIETAPEFTIDLSAQPAGIYLVNVFDGKNLISRKIIKE
jgi:hypothetical protein